MIVQRIDHLVLTVTSIENTVSFYNRVLGMEKVTFGNDRTALRFGLQKINLHQAGAEFEPKAARPIPGSADLCFIVEEPISDVMAEVKSCGYAIEAGPIERTGANGPIQSIYIRDPDENLIELSQYI